MAANQSHSMNADFSQGTIDGTYMQLTPGRANVENPPTERMAWPTYVNVERFADDPHVEAHIRKSRRPVERKAVYGSDPRF